MSEAMLEFREVDVFYGPIEALRRCRCRSTPGRRWR